MTHVRNKFPLYLVSILQVTVYFLEFLCPFKHFMIKILL